MDSKVGSTERSWIFVCVIKCIKQVIGIYCIRRETFMSSNERTSNNLNYEMFCILRSCIFNTECTIQPEKSKNMCFLVSGVDFRLGIQTHEVYFTSLGPRGHGICIFMLRRLHCANCSVLHTHIHAAYISHRNSWS